MWEDGTGDPMFKLGGNVLQERRDSYDPVSKPDYRRVAKSKKKEN